ncbi:MAG: TAXI family TRAP transporter solute-binding subunit [Betaproteobacteria bacterium]|nr:TAXI family TRAP transporter solute-binding subunit [Betaproteobacteria bacterium]
MRRYAWLVPTLLIVLVTVVVAWKLLKPGAPTRVVLATGATGGAYEGIGKKYAEIFKRDGVTLELKPTKGSVENLALLLDKNNDIEAALVQSGLAKEAEREELVSLGSLFYEPVWVFYREAANKNPLTRITELAGKRIAVGAIGGGTRPVSEALLSANQISAANARFNDASPADATELLLRDEVDAMFLVAAPSSPLVQKLFANPKIRLMNMATADAYSRVIPSLSKITIPRGVIDLKNDIPPQDVQAVAATATLVAMESLHPAIAYLFVKAAKEVHEGGSVLHAMHEFPNVTRYQEFVVPENVALLYKDGAPFLYRHLPFWLANLVQRLWVLLIPLGAIAVSVSDALPKLLGYRMNFRITQIYQAAHKLEDELIRVAIGGEAITPAMIDTLDERLRALHARTDRLKGPSTTLKAWYELRSHLALVQKRVENLRGK